MQKSIIRGSQPANSMDDFYMVLPSNSCPTTQPDNSASNYIVNWENPIELTGKWKAALTEFTINYEPMNITDNDMIKLQYEHDHFETPVHIVIKNGELSFEWVKFPNLRNQIDISLDKYGLFNISSDNVADVQPIFPNKEVMEDLGYYTDGRAQGRAVDNIDTTLDMSVSKGIKWNKIISFYEKLSIGSVDEFFQHILAHLPDDIKSITLNKEGKVEIHFKSNCLRVAFTESLANTLGFPTSLKVESNKIIGMKKATILRPFDKLFIYVSITEPILVGGVYAPLIRMINVKPLLGGGENTLHIDVRNLMYIPMSTWSINSVEVQIRDDSGRLIPFTYGSKSSLTLHVKKYE